MNPDNKMFYLHFWVNSKSIFPDLNDSTMYIHIKTYTNNTNITFLHYCTTAGYANSKTAKKIFYVLIEWIFKKYKSDSETQENPAIPAMPAIPGNPAIPGKPYILKSKGGFNEIYNA